MTLAYIPYTYLIGWSGLDLWYYGSEFKKTANPENLWTTYFTSSKRVKQLRIEHGEPDVVQVRRTFTTRENAYRWEQTVLHRLKVANEPKWINRAVYGFKEFSCDAERNNAIVATRKANGKAWHSDECKARISQARQNKVMALSEQERERRRLHFTQRNLSDALFIEQNRLGRARRWAKPEMVERQAEVMREAITKRFQKLRGWQVIVVGDHKFSTISACASHLGCSVYFVKKMIREGHLVTLSE